MMKLFEIFTYGIIFQYQSIPTFIHELIQKYNDDKCIFCMESLSNDKSIVLICGHQYHHKCVRQWERLQFKRNPTKLHKCPLCSRAYDWTQKYSLT